MANVLSTTRIAPTSCAAAAAAAMSTTFSTGFDGVSIQTMRVRSSRCSREVRELLGREVVEDVALRLVDLRRHPVDAAVDVGDQHRPVARVQQVHERRRGAEARRERDAVLCALERGEAELQRRARRVGDARVVVALVLADRLLDVRGGLVDRDRHGAGRRIRLLSLVDRARLEVHASIVESGAPPGQAGRRSVLSARPGRARRPAGPSPAPLRARGEPRRRAGRRGPGGGVPPRPRSAPPAPRGCACSSRTDARSRRTPASLRRDSTRRLRPVEATMAATTRTATTIRRIHTQASISPPLACRRRSTRRAPRGSPRRLCATRRTPARS